MSGSVPTAALTHGRHCPCTACAKEDWTRPDLAPCGMHGPDCPAVYAPVSSAAGQPTHDAAARVLAYLDLNAGYWVGEDEQFGTDVVLLVAQAGRAHKLEEALEAIRDLPSEHDLALNAVARALYEIALAALVVAGRETP